MFFERAYMAGLKPEEVWRATMVEVLRCINAYDKRVLQFFNLNTRMLAWQLTANMAEKGKMPSFDNFWNLEEKSDNELGEDLQTRANYMRAMLKKNGYLKN